MEMSSSQGPVRLFLFILFHFFLKFVLGWPIYKAGSGRPLYRTGKRKRLNKVSTDTDVGAVEKTKDCLMVINTNLAATSSARLLSGSTTMLQKSLARLSSGSKIVSPEDDAAGLAQA